MTDLSIVIINRNTKELLRSCIGSIEKTVQSLTFEIWVVDNGSYDGSVEAIRSNYPQVKFIENRNNLGFAAANNQAIRCACGRYVVLLNTDTVLTESALSNIINFMDRHPRVGVCGGQLLNNDGSPQNSIANIPTLATELLNKSLLRRLFPSRYPGKETLYDYPVEVESIIGACMVVRKEAIDQVGLLDESYFFYFEETAWCLSMKKKGWQIYFEPTSKIYHLQGHTAKKNVLATRIEYWKSRYTFFRKEYTLGTFVALAIGLLVKLCISVAIQCVVSPWSRNARKRLRVNVQLLFWHLLGCPSGWGLKSATVEK